jgi:hypothetical protein
MIIDDHQHPNELASGKYLEYWHAAEVSVFRTRFGAAKTF